MHRPDGLDDYLRGDSALSVQYRRESAPLPPPALDRCVLECARADSRFIARERCAQSPYLAPLALAASVLLSLAVVLAIVCGPRTNARRGDDAPRLVRTAAHAGFTPNASLNHRHDLYSSDPPHARPAAAWLTEIGALRRAGRNREADAELRRFCSAYPNYAGGELKALL
ncbi:MAG: hypothetical protein ABJC66_14095 [Gammaproteobacteria bacterium]